MVDGPSIGGDSELALDCVDIGATNKGSFDFPKASIGIDPRFGGTQRLSHRIGVPLAKP